MAEVTVRQRAESLHKAVDVVLGGLPVQGRQLVDVTRLLRELVGLVWDLAEELEQVRTSVPAAEQVNGAVSSRTESLGTLSRADVALHEACLRLRGRERRDDEVRAIMRRFGCTDKEFGEVGYGSAERSVPVSRRE